jgi:hypothetical protein
MGLLREFEDGLFDTPSTVEGRDLTGTGSSLVLGISRGSLVLTGFRVRGIPLSSATGGGVTALDDGLTSAIGTGTTIGLLVNGLPDTLFTALAVF